MYTRFEKLIAKHWLVIALEVGVVGMGVAGWQVTRMLAGKTHSADNAVMGFIVLTVFAVLYTVLVGRKHVSTEDQENFKEFENSIGDRNNKRIAKYYKLIVAGAILMAGAIGWINIVSGTSVLIFTIVFTAAMFVIYYATTQRKRLSSG